MNTFYHIIQRFAIHFIYFITNYHSPPLAAISSPHPHLTPCILHITMLSYSRTLRICTCILNFFLLETDGVPYTLSVFLYLFKTHTDSKPPHNFLSLFCIRSHITSFIESFMLISTHLSFITLTYKNPHKSIFSP